MSTVAHIILSPAEKFHKVILDQQRTSQYAHNLEDWSSQREVVFDDCDKAICDNSDVDLYSHGILAVSPETFDTEMLLDPFEEKLDLPTVTVKESDVLGCEVEVVGVVHERASEVGCIIDDSAQFCRVIPRVVPSCEPDGLVKENTVISIQHILAVDNLEFGIAFLPNDKECPAEMYLEEPGKVEIATVEDVAGIGLVFNPVHSLVVADFGVCDSVEDGYFCNDVDLGVYFDAGLCAAEERPAEYGHTEVDGCGIDGVETSVKFKFLGDSTLLGKRHHIERKLLEYPRVAEHIGFRERVPDNGRVAESKLIASFCMCHSNVCEFPERAATEELTEDEHKQMVPVRKTPSLCPIVEFGHNSAELPLWQKHCNLGEYVSSVVHLCFILKETKVRNSSPGQYFFAITKCA